MASGYRAQFGLPFRVSADGRAAGASADEHIRHLIELTLFTRQGERVNRPDFGSGVDQLIFSENSPELANAIQHLVQASLQRWLADLIELQSVDVSAVDATLAVTVRYRNLETGEPSVARFVRET